VVVDREGLLGKNEPVTSRDFAYLAVRFAAMAHRGGANWEPNLGRENTLHAFQQAISLGFRYIETDVQATRDGQLVCFHDNTLERMVGVPGRVADYSAAELRELKLIGGDPIPFFSEVVETLPTTCFNVDMKTNDSVDPLAAAIFAHGLEDRVLADSFSRGRTARFRALTRGKIPVAMAPPGVAWSAFVPFISGLIASPAQAAQVPVWHRFGGRNLEVVTRASIDRIHRAGKVIHVWTIDDPEEMERLIDLGVDGIITDRPDLLREVLIECDLWPV
jgi:glycerophosphoryl diester phosphodiesterase